MALRAPRGTEDLLPEAYANWKFLTERADEIFSRYGYLYIETPLFEHLDVFVHGIGESSDVVSKEMFRVLSPDGYSKVAAGKAESLKADQRLALRPEGTASVVRAVLEHSLIMPGSAPIKLMYSGPMFRAERQQRGRLRQFHQIGAECLGAPDVMADAEVIIMLMEFFERAGLKKDSLTLLINTLGDDNCRPQYRQEIQDYLLKYKDELPEETLRQAELNPLRAFDSKIERVQEIMADAPLLKDRLCDECKKHYEELKSYLDVAGISYEEDPRLVRGLDYYTRTVFEIQVKDGLGAQNAIGGGGRYDKLIEISGGKPTPALGFAVGMERILLALEDQEALPAHPRQKQIYVAYPNEHTKAEAFFVVQRLRSEGFVVETDYQGRSLKSQLKLANKLQVAYVAILGEDEIAQKSVRLKDMDKGTEELVAYDNLAAHIVL